jgi:phosphoglucomutase
MEVEVIDPVPDYLALLQKLIDFDAIAALARSGFSLLYDGLNGVTGPYAHSIFVDALGFPAHSLVRCTPLPDFGGQHPDPNPVYAGQFHSAMMGSSAADFGAACDSDGDRHMIMGRRLFVTPSDSLALLAQHIHLAPGYTNGLFGVARSVGTSSAVDRVARSLGVKCYETPTGWKYFGNLLDSGLISLCGEESAGASSHHIREKDGLWAVLLWLNILARTKKSVTQLMTEHWQQFGRTYYERRDYEEVDEGPCITLLSKLRARIGSLAGKATLLGPILSADDFSYHDVVDGSVAHQQGIRLRFEQGSRLVMRLSGTGTAGATLRLYGERYDAHRFDRVGSEYLELLFDIVDQISGVSAYTRRYEPTLVT